MPEPTTRATQRQCDLVLLIALLVFLWNAWPSLSHGPIGLDDKALLASFADAKLARIWGHDHFGHLRPIKNLYFWALAQDPALISLMRGLGLLTAVACAWLVRSSCLVLGSSPLWAACAGALWLLNPTTAVGVAWLSANNYLFALLGMLLYLMVLERAAFQARWTDVALAHLALLFAVLNHELAMLTPVWALLLHRKAGRAVLLGIGAAVVLSVPIVLRLSASAPELAYRTKLPAPKLVASAAYNLVQNFRLWFWLPGRFGVLLSQTSELDPLLSLAAWLGTISAAWLLWRVSKTQRGARLALVWVLLFLLPVINLLPLGVTPVATHYLILPGVGLAWLSASALQRMERRHPRRGAALSSLAAAVLIISWQSAFRQVVRAYRDDTALYEASLANYPDNPEVRVNLIAAYKETGRAGEAEDLLQRSLDLSPEHPGLLKLQLLSLLQSERSAEAQAWFARHKRRVQEDPDLSLRHALMLRKLGRTSEAERSFEHVLSIARDPDIRATAGYQLANLHVQTGRLAEARALLSKLHRELPEHPDIELALRLINDILQNPEP